MRLVTCLCLSFVAALAPAARADSLTAQVNPLIGTANRGNTFPGAALPFGMVQLSPDDGATPGYAYDNVRIDGFSHTHLSGVGCGALGEVRVMPTTGAVTSSRPSHFGSHYSHRTEVAHPGYYAVTLTKYGVRAELTATTRTGWHRYTFPATKRANLLFDVGRADMPVLASRARVVGNQGIEGWQDTGRFCHGPDHHRVYFVARFSRPFTATGTWQGDRLSPGGRTGTGGAWLTFDTTANRTVEAQVALSYTGLAGARRNLAAETAGQTFDSVAATAAADWSSLLSRVQVSGGGPAQQTVFATALYHSLLHPNVVSDVDGRYSGADDRLHAAHDYVPMGNLSLWDTFRTQNFLLELLAPDVARNVALSLLADARDGGWLPRWPLVSSDASVMTGDPVTPFLVENWSNGLLAGHVGEAYRTLRDNALETPPHDADSDGRSGNGYYTRLGYIPTGVRCHTRGTGGDCRRPASATLEYAAADGALALMARGLGHTAVARLLAHRAENFRRLWDGRYFHPRDRRGHFLEPYNPTTGSRMFHEGNAYSYGWLTPQDPAELVRLLGGHAGATRRLDDFFDYSGLLADPASTARHAWVSRPYDYYRAKTYNPNNEPDLHAPFLYAWTGAPARTQTVVAVARTLFTDAPGGLTGNDDLGTMSAWYVLASLGLYPTMSGAGYFVLTTPAFPHATVALGAVGSRQGGTLHIDAPGPGAYVSSASFDGRPVTTAWLGRAVLAHGGTLSFTRATHPTTWAASAPPPPSVR